jgi:hypothetical protein
MRVATAVGTARAQEGVMNAAIAVPQPMDEIRRKLTDADLLLDQGLNAIHRGASMEAMEDVYTASCLIADIRAALDEARRSADISSGA